MTRCRGEPEDLSIEYTELKQLASTYEPCQELKPRTTKLLLKNMTMETHHGPKLAKIFLK